MWLYSGSDKLSYGELFNQLSWGMDSWLFLFLGEELVISRAKVLKRSEICAFSFDYQKVFVNFAPV